MLHTLTSSVAATGLWLVTISLTPETQMGDSAPCTALTVPGGAERNLDEDLRVSDFRMTQKGQLKLECSTMPVTYHNHDMQS